MKRAIYCAFIILVLGTQSRGASYCYDLDNRSQLTTIKQKCESNARIKAQKGATELIDKKTLADCLASELYALNIAPIKKVVSLCTDLTVLPDDQIECMYENLGLKTVRSLLLKFSFGEQKEYCKEISSQELILLVRQSCRNSAAVNGGPMMRGEAYLNDELTCLAQLVPKLRDNSLAIGIQKCTSTKRVTPRAVCFYDELDQAAARTQSKQEHIIVTNAQ